VRENQSIIRCDVCDQLLKLGFEVAESTVSKYMIGRWDRHRRASGHSCATMRTPLRRSIYAWFPFERLFAFLVLGHGRRQLLWFAVTRNPSAEWLAQQNRWPALSPGRERFWS
jgi:hypothetical protein